MGTGKIVAIVQARMGSRRLPGKVMLKLGQKPVIWHVVNRLGRCRLVDQIAVATTRNSEDGAIGRWCKQQHIAIFRGSSSDLLDRYREASIHFGAESVLRITADCPVLDSDIVDLVIQEYRDGKWDYFGLSGEYPNGLDCTIMGFDTLDAAWREATLPSDREHVGPYIERNGNRFKVGGLEYFHGQYKQRWTLDESADYEFLENIFQKLGPDSQYFGARQILDLLREYPELKQINAHIVRNEGYLFSVSQDPQ